MHVPYKGIAPAIVDVIGGQVTMTFSSIISGAPHLKSGKVRALAVTGGHRSPALPELPTAKFTRSEMEKYAKVVKAANVNAE